MQLIIAATIIGLAITFIGTAVLKFLKMDIARRHAECQLKKAATDLLSADYKPTKHERASAEANAKVKLKLALKECDSAISRFVEAES
ncbi:MAG: hypothetical protein MK188_14100 [Gammaproteobacteria bacterium]|nr:hypothetical protein [Gammaproteobacteria bacterium]